MKRAVVLAVMLGITASWAALVEPALLEQMAKADANDYIGVTIALERQLDAQTIIRTIKNKQQRWETTVSALKAMAQEDQAGLLAELETYARQGKVKTITPLWIANAVYCEATTEVINAIANRDEVWFVQWDLIPTENALALAPNNPSTDALDGSFTVEWNVRKVKADSVWLVYGYTGNGVVVGDIDTGCDYTHPDLAGHMWTDPNYPYHGWNFEQNNNNPMDAHGHGTHTCGTVAGNGTGGDTTGMAPNARIMTTRTKTSISQPYPDTIAENTVMNSMQFCVAPPLSPDNHAHLLTMSLGWIIRSWSPRQALWRQCVTNVAAAGLPYFIAAGNEGSSSPPYNLRCPGNVPSPWHHPAAIPGGVGGSISIGATTSADVYASFTSWGPVKWDTIPPYNDYPYPPGLLKPDISAPGENITSTRLGGGYTQMSGTSMATPCAAGVCALMLEKNPTLLPEEVDSIMQMSVLPLGSQPKNNTYGTGRIDAMRCIENTPLPFGVRFYRAVIDDSAGGNNDGIINPGETINLPVWVKNQCDYTTNGVEARLRTTDTCVVITDSVRYIGAIVEGDTGYTGDDGFHFSVAGSVPNGYTMKFELSITDTLDSLWTSGFALKAGRPVLEGDSVYAFDSGNGKLDPGEECDIAVQLVNSGLGNAYQVTAVLVSGDVRLAVLDSTGDYGLVPADSWVMNLTDRFRVRASASIPREFVIPCTLRVSQLGYPVQNVPFGIEVGRLTAVDPIPDGPRTPALYWAYDDADSMYAEAPRFSWVEIRNLGTRLTLSDDQTVVIDLPSSFGPFRFYNQNFTQVSICGNGWVAPGYTTSSAYSNTNLPTTTLPGALCINWDDLYPPTGGGVWYYHDQANHRFIIEWDSVAYYSSRTTFDKNQIILYDTTLAAYDGNCEFLFQYLTANQTSSATVGEQDPTVQIAIEVLYNTAYHRAAMPILPGRAIKFTTDTIVTGLAEGANVLSSRRLGLAPSRNPFSRSVVLNYSLPSAARVRVSVCDASGRVVRDLVNSGGELVAPGVYSVAWNGRDNSGRELAAGIYFYRLTSSVGNLSRKAVLTR